MYLCNELNEKKKSLISRLQLQESFMFWQTARKKCDFHEFLAKQWCACIVNLKHMYIKKEKAERKFCFTDDLCPHLPWNSKIKCDKMPYFGNSNHEKAWV